MGLLSHEHVRRWFGVDVIHRMWRSYNHIVDLFTLGHACGRFKISAAGAHPNGL